VKKSRKHQIGNIPAFFNQLVKTRAAEPEPVIFGGAGAVFKI